MGRVAAAAARSGRFADDLDVGDVLGRWMAHHLSDLIVGAEGAIGGQSLERCRRDEPFRPHPSKYAVVTYKSSRVNLADVAAGKI